MCEGRLGKTKFEGFFSAKAPQKHHDAPEPLEDANPSQLDQTPVDVSGVSGDLPGHSYDSGVGGEAPWFATSDLDDIAELYAMAVLRDVPLDQVSTCSTSCGAALVSPCDVALALGTLDPNFGGDRGALSARMFRGPWSGALSGPFVSQFLLVGDGESGASGRVLTPQGVLSQARPGLLPIDYYTDWASWSDAQTPTDRCPDLSDFTVPRFPTAARDLAALVRPGSEAVASVLRATSLILDSHATPWAPGIWLEGPGAAGAIAWQMAKRAEAEARRMMQRLAAWPRPDQIAGLLTLVANGRGADLGATQSLADRLFQPLSQSRLLHWIATQARRVQADPAHCSEQRGSLSPPWTSCLLPQAYPESPACRAGFGLILGAMIGAGVTALKLLYDQFDAPRTWTEKGLRAIRMREVYAPSEDGQRLTTVFTETDLTLTGELDKLAANLGLAPAMAGLAGRSECLAGVQLGERLALAGLPEILGPTAPELRCLGFDGAPVVLGGAGLSP